MKKIDSFIESIYKDVDAKKNNEIAELKMEMKDHLMQAVKELQSDGTSEDDAIKIALERFGDEKQITFGLFELFQAQKRFAKNLFRISLTFLLLSIISLIVVGWQEQKYTDDWNQLMNGVATSIDKDAVLSQDEVVAIENHVKSYVQKHHDSLIFIAVFYDANLGQAMNIMPHENLTEAKYVWRNPNMNIKNTGTTGLSLDNHWAVEASIIQNKWDSAFLIPIISFIIFCVLVIIWLIVYLYHRRHINK